jgi:hypothetical protein
LPGSLGVAVKTVLYLVCGVWHQGFSLRFFVELLAIGPNAMTTPSAGAVCATGLASASLKNFCILGKLVFEAMSRRFGSEVRGY